MNFSSNQVQQILNDNLISKEKLLEYIYDDFRVDLDKIKKIVVYHDHNNSNVAEIPRIPHHRYNLHFNKHTGELYILPLEGRLRVEHILLEVRCLEEIFSKQIEFHEENFIALDDEPQRVSKEIIDSCGNYKVAGIIIGSLWNFNFFLNKHIRPNFLSSIIKLLNLAELNRYVDYRLKLIILEEELINKKLSIEQIDTSIFKEGVLPSKEEFEKITSILNSIPFIEKRVDEKKNQQNLMDYLITDYLFFFDLHTGTDFFSYTINFPETKIIKDRFLTYQILNINNNIYINLPWAHPKALSRVIDLLQNNFTFQSFFMYGKCGSLIERHNVGTLVAPSSIESNGDRIDIKNSILDLPLVAFTSVISPLVETKSWVKEKITNNIQCVEMELYENLKVLSPDIKKTIIYYISDLVGSEYNLSIRLEFLSQRLEIVNRILDNVII